MKTILSIVMIETPKNSPCIGVCKLNEHLICRGCGRTVEQIQKAGEKRSLPIVVNELYPLVDK